MPKALSRVEGVVCQAVAILLVYQANAYSQHVNHSNRCICEILSRSFSASRE